MKVYSYRMLEQDTFNHPERGEDFDAAKDLIHLGQLDGREWYSYNPATVTLVKQNDEKYEFREYDPKVEDDKKILDSVVKKLTYTSALIVSTKQSIFEGGDLFDVLHGLSTGDKYTKDTIKAAFDKIEQDLENLGF
jgi:hypothetical protein